MHIHVVGESSSALLIGAMLAAAGNEVTIRGGVPLLRMALPDGWETVRLGDSDDATGTAEADFVLVDDASSVAARGAGGDRLVLIDSGLRTDWTRPGETEPVCVALFDALADGRRSIELIDSGGLIVAPRRGAPGRLLGALRRRGVRLEEAVSASGHRIALAVLRLLDLPIALCGTTREAFLSSGDGRRIAEVVLEEGLGVVGKAELPLDRLPWSDPAELLQQIKRRPQIFDAGRQAPGRRYPPAVHAILRGEEVRFGAQRSLVRRAGELGLSADWTWRLLGLLPRVARAGFLAGPADLLRAVG